MNRLADTIAEKILIRPSKNIGTITTMGYKHPYIQVIAWKEYEDLFHLINSLETHEHTLLRQYKL